MSIEREEQASAVSAVGYKAALLLAEVRRAKEVCKDNERLDRWLDRVGGQAESVEETANLIVGIVQESGT